MPLIVRFLGAVFAVVILASCQSGTKAPTPASPKPGSTQVQGLAFVPPDGLKRVEDKTKQRNQNASLEMVGKTESEAAAPALDVFVERGKIGPLDARTASIVDMIKLQLTDPEIVRNEKIDVPGALEGRVIEATFSCGVGGQSGSSVPCRQVEILVQMPKKPHYGIRYGMPERDYSESELDALVSSVRITKR